jgi:long-chain acyl-CoA synthetase
MSAVRNLTLGATIRENARSTPHKTSVICGHVSLTHRELANRIALLTGAFRRAGVEKGDRIAWLGQNCHRWIEVLVAGGEVGAMICSLNWRHTSSETEQALKDFRPRIVIWQGLDFSPPSDGMRAAASNALWMAQDDDGPGGYESFMHAGPPDDWPSSGDADSPVLVLSVADAGGGSSGAMLSHTNLLVPGLLMAGLQEITAQTMNLASAPLFHIASMFTLIPTLQMRGTNVMVRRADPALICTAIHTHRCSHGFLFGPTADAIVEMNQDGTYDLHSFRSSLPNPRWQKMVSLDESAWGRRAGGYGQSETGMVVIAALADTASSTSGLAAPYAEVCIVDSDDLELPADAVGQIVVRGASVHRGYWNRVEQNAERFRGGWWHTRDLGKRSADGMITFVGPMGRIIKSGAENVYTAEVERCLMEHPAVLEAAVFGVPDAVWIQTVKAVVVQRNGSSVTEQELTDFCRQRLAGYKKPRSIVFQSDPLPRSGPAIDYASIDAFHGGGNYPGEGTRSI